MNEFFIFFSVIITKNDNFRIWYNQNLEYIIIAESLHVQFLIWHQRLVLRLHDNVGITHNAILRYTYYRHNYIPYTYLPTYQLPPPSLCEQQISQSTYSRLPGGRKGPGSLDSLRGCHKYVITGKGTQRSTPFSPLWI